MSTPKCAVCGHLNRVGAEICEMCDARLEAEAAGASRPFYTAQPEEPRDGVLSTEIPSPQFKGAGDVISPTLEVYRKDFLLVGLIVLVTAVPLVAVQFGIGGLLGLLTSDATDEAVMSGPAGLFPFIAGTTLLTWLVSQLADALQSGALVYGVIELRRTGRAKAGDCLRWGLRKLPKVFLVLVLYTLVVWAGLLLLIVPGIIFSLMFALVVPVAAAEDRGIVETFKRSAELTRGYRGLIFLTYFLWGLVIVVVNLIISGSFHFSSDAASVTAAVLQALVGQMLASSATVLTVFIFLGILSEQRHGFETRTVTPAG